VIIWTPLGAPAPYREAMREPAARTPTRAPAPGTGRERVRPSAPRRPFHRPLGRPVSALLTGLVAVAVAVLLVGLRIGGGGHLGQLGGLPNAGPAVGWGLPVVRTVADLALLAAVGTALLAVLLPLHRHRLSADARAALRGCAVVTAVGTVAFTVTALLTFADEVGNLSEAIRPAVLRAYLPGATSAVDLLVTAALLLIGCVDAGWAARQGGRDATAGPLLLAFAAILPIALTGHASTGPRHLLALASLSVHLVAVCVWVGGLGALTVYALGRGPALAAVVLRYSPIAAACYVAVGLSGVVNAVTRLTAPDQLVTIWYGRLILAKAAAFGLLGLVALGQRRRILPALATDPGESARAAFARLATVEVLLMAATVGIAVALSRTPTPAIGAVGSTAQPAAAVLRGPDGWSCWESTAARWTIGA
jgi:putative copper export protein